MAFESSRGGEKSSQHWFDAPRAAHDDDDDSPESSSSSDSGQCAHALHPAVSAHARQHAALVAVSTAAPPRSSVPFGNAPRVAPQKRFRNGSFGEAKRSTASNAARVVGGPGDTF